MDLKFFFLSYVDDCVYWYKNEYLGKWFVDNLGKRFHVNFLGYAHWFMSIRISQLKDNSIYVESCSSPRWDNLPSGHQWYLLKGLNLGFMYWGQKHSSE